MTHETAKQLLERATTLPKRTLAVDVAYQMGMPLEEIEDYLDWLDVIEQISGQRRHESRIDPPHA